MDEKDDLSLSARRAWIEMTKGSYHTMARKSLSARRAWIEMLGCRIYDMSAASLSARRAWIEITAQTAKNTSIAVALRKESVDRNIHTKNLCISVIRRSPQGERG